MNISIRPFALAAVLGLTSSLAVAGGAFGADLLEAPTGDQAYEAGAWTTAVSASYANRYADTACSAVPLPDGGSEGLDLGDSPHGEWFFVVVASAHGLDQYGPIEFTPADVPLGSGTEAVIACHGTVVATPRTLLPETTVPAQVTVPISALEETGTATPTPEAVPHEVASGIDGGSGGLVALSLGGVAVGGLALLGLRRGAQRR